MQRKRYTYVYEIIALLLFAILANSCQQSESMQLPATRPNFIIVLTDDMDLRLTAKLDKTNSLIGQRGVTFTNFFVTSPACCPSRASLLRGQYPHNTTVLSNIPPDGGYQSFFAHDGEAGNLAVWLNRVGYRTSLVGKYLNGYPVPNTESYIPPGWTDWHVFLYQSPGENEESNYFHFPMNENGAVVQYDDTPTDYSTDVIRDKSIHFIDKSISDDAPFFILISVYAPHGPSIPAPRHATLFQGSQYPQSPSFNEGDLSDKPSIIRSLTSNGEETDVSDANRLYLQRARSMQAVDELVGDLINTLEKSGGLNNTYIFFTSDNGFHIGEHQLPPGKATPYEEDIHVPLMIRGPGIHPNTIVAQLAANIDIAPTIIDLAGIERVNILDGRSLVPLLKSQDMGPIKWRNGLLIEMGNMTTAGSAIESQLPPELLDTKRLILEFPDATQANNLAQINTIAFRSIRAENFIYTEYNTDDVEYYDLTRDPYELDNAASRLGPNVLSTLHTWLKRFQQCASQDCSEIEVAFRNEMPTP